MIRQLPKVESASRMNRAARWDSKQKGGPERVVDYAQGSVFESNVFDPQQLLSNAPFERSEREYSPSETIFLQGEPANAVFYIENGEVKLSVISENGKQAIVDIFGEK